MQSIKYAGFRRIISAYLFNLTFGYATGGMEEREVIENGLAEKI